MAHIITVATKKGGAGKTTTAHTLAHGLYHRGYKTLLIDLDQQANATLNSGIDKDAEGIITSLEFMQGKANAIKHTNSVDVIPANNMLSLANTIFVDVGKEYKLKEALEPLQSVYNYIVIDTPPTMEILTINALAASNDVIIPVQANMFNVQGIAELKQVIEMVKKYCNPQLNIAGLLLTRYNARATLHKDVKSILEDIAKGLNTKLFTSAISQCVAIEEAQAEQQSILDYAPKSNGALQYNEFITEYLQEIKK